MARKSKADAVASAALKMPTAPKVEQKRALAEMALSPTIPNAHTARQYAKTVFTDEIDMTECVSVLKGSIQRVKAGDLSGLEATLTAQVSALDAIFNAMAQRAAMNMGQHLSATETYLRLAFKAQSQCRSTVEALAEIKNPRPIAFVQQANISSGPQQVNNGVPECNSVEFATKCGRAGAHAHAHAGEIQSPQSKLLGASNGTQLESGGTTRRSGGVKAPASTATRRQAQF